MNRDYHLRVDATSPDEAKVVAVMNDEFFLFIFGC